MLSKWWIFALLFFISQDATSHLNLGAMLHVNGKFDEAEISYLAALKLKPDDSITQANLQKLRQIFSKKGRSQSRWYQ